jgi:hypothetical protein
VAPKTLLRGLIAAGVLGLIGGLLGLIGGSAWGWVAVVCGVGIVALALFERRRPQ